VDAILERALHLWGDPLPAGSAALTAFREVYADPVTVNGEPTDLQVLVDRARMLQTAIVGIRHEVHEAVVTPGRRAFAFSISGRHAGPLASPVGTVEPSGRDVRVAGMDIFVVDEGRAEVTAIWAVADWLDLLVQAGAVG
jgi:predicted ester cyclase